MNKQFKKNIQLPVSDRPQTQAQYYSPQDFHQYWKYKQEEEPEKIAWQNKIQQNPKNINNYFSRNVRTPQSSQNRQHFSYIENQSQRVQSREQPQNYQQQQQQQETKNNSTFNQQQQTTQEAYQISQEQRPEPQTFKPDLPKPMKYISHGKQHQHQNCQFKDTSLGLQQIVEGFPEYFDHLRGDCACGKCICGNCKCEISRLPKQQPNLNPSHYQQNFGPKNNKYLNGQLNRNIANPPAQSINQNPIDNQTTTKVKKLIKQTLLQKTSYLRPGPTHFELVKKKIPEHEDQELIGHSNYQENYKNWGSNKLGPILPCNATEVLNKVPFAGMSNYDENYNKKHGLDNDPAIARIIEKCKIPMFKSPINPSNFPFIGQSTSSRNFHPFAPYNNQSPKMSFIPTSLPSTLWKTTHARDFGDKGERECPGRAYVIRSYMKRRNNH